MALAPSTAPCMAAPVECARRWLVPCCWSAAMTWARSAKQLAWQGPVPPPPAFASAPASPSPPPHMRLTLSGRLMSGKEISGKEKDEDEDEDESPPAAPEPPAAPIQAPLPPVYAAALAARLRLNAASSACVTGSPQKTHELRARKGIARRRRSWRVGEAGEGEAAARAFVRHVCGEYRIWWWRDELSHLTKASTSSRCSAPSWLFDSLSATNRSMRACRSVFGCECGGGHRAQVLWGELAARPASPPELPHRERPRVQHSPRHGRGKPLRKPALNVEAVVGQIVGSDDRVVHKLTRDWA
jgi:hypothetical protein